jgi:hypothetical protein
MKRMPTTVKRNAFIHSDVLHRFASAACVTAQSEAQNNFTDFTDKIHTYPGKSYSMPSFCSFRLLAASLATSFFTIFCFCSGVFSLKQSEPDNFKKKKKKLPNAPCCAVREQSFARE